MKKITEQRVVQEYSISYDAQQKCKITAAQRGLTPDEMIEQLIQASYYYGNRPIKTSGHVVNTSRNGGKK